MSKTKHATPPKPASRGAKVTSPDNTLAIALSLAAIGWPVFPVNIYEDETGKRHKVPAVKWKDEATTDADTIREWWTGQHRRSWIGVYAGAAGIVTLDVDPGGDASLAQHALTVPATFNYPSHRKGGRHHVFAAPMGVDLTIARDLEHDGEKLSNVDVRSGAGLMIYYGPELTEPPKLAPAPEWLLVTREKTSATGGDLADRAPHADLDAYLSRLAGGKPDEVVRDALALVKREGMTHDDMLEAVTALVSLGARGHRGVAKALEVARDTYARDWPDAARHWDNAVIGSIKRIGLPPATLELSKAERKEVKRRNRPEVIEARQAERKATFRVEKHSQALTTPDAGTRVLEDAPLATELAGTLAGRWSYSRGMGIMRWDGSRWRSAEEHSLIEAVRRELLAIEVAEHEAAAHRGDNKGIDKARTLLSRSRSAAVARLVVGILAEREPAFDDHPDLLNTPSGVVDLRTGELLPHDPAMHLTKMTGAPYDPDADMTMWLRASSSLPPKVVDWMQERMGQAATGYTPEDDMLVILEGAGENGKTAWLIGARRALGDYAATLPDRLLMADPGDHPTTLMTLQGARMGVIEELPEGRALNVKRLKDVVGTPEITARKMRQDDITFPATHALFLSTNYLPIVSETDHGTWRRLALVRFRHRYVKDESEMTGKRDRLGDPSIKRHFERGADPGLLRWIVEGARRWYANGQSLSKPPKRVVNDTRAWRMDADPILAYVAERLERDPSRAVAVSDLADDFNVWLERRGHRRWTSQTIAARFQGHVSMDGVERRQVRWSAALAPSRTRNALVARSLPPNAQSWVGIRFVDDTATAMSEAERDAEILADLERRATS